MTVRYTANVRTRKFWLALAACCQRLAVCGARCGIVSMAANDVTTCLSSDDCADIVKESTVREVTASEREIYAFYYLLDGPDRQNWSADRPGAQAY